MSPLVSIFFFVVLLSSVILCAFLLLLYLRRLYLRLSFRRLTSQRAEPASICIVLGSGGHTSEMLRVVEALPAERYSPRHYVLAETDSTSLQRLEQSERNRSKIKNTGYSIFRIPRSREVRQSYASSILSTLNSMFRCAPLMYDLKCDVLLVNGPGTCVPVCFFAFLYNLILFRRCQVIFVESLCRVETLSTTGKILYYLGIADEVLVQWPQLTRKYWSSVYLGRFI